MLRKILIIESEPLIQKEVEQPLKQSGFDITVVSDGLAAIDVALKHPPDIILVDYTPEEINNLTFFQEIRQKEHLGVIPVVLLVHPTDTCVLIQIESAGVRAYLKKPINTTELIGAVQKQIQWLNNGTEGGAASVKETPVGHSVAVSQTTAVEIGEAMRQHIDDLVETVVRDRLSEVFDTVVTKEAVVGIVEKVTREMVAPVAVVEITKEIKRLRADTQ